MTDQDTSFALRQIQEAIDGMNGLLLLANLPLLSKVNTTVTNLATANANITTALTNIATANANINTTLTNLATANANINTTLTNLATANTNINTTLTNVNTALTNLATANTALGTLSEQIVTPFSVSSIGANLASFSLISSPASGAFPTANGAIYVPFHITLASTAYKMFWVNGGAVSGNVDVGIYSAAGSRLVSMGSTAQAGTNTMQIANIADTALAAGNYYMAIACDNTTGTLLRHGDSVVPAELFGMGRQGTAFALPSTATFAASVAAFYIPVFGVALSSTFA